MSEDIHTRADALQRASHGRLTHAEALRILGARGNAARRAKQARAQVEPGAFASVESPARPYWWNSPDR